MDDFLKELPALIVTLFVLAMATALIIFAHVNFGDAIAIISPAIAFWFMRGAFSWQPSQQNTSPPFTAIAARTSRSIPPSSTVQPPPPPTGT